jgi:hypothetical protein
VPEQQPQYYINCQKVAATLDLLELAGIKARHIHFPVGAPLATDIVLSNFEARLIPLNFYAIIQRITYSSYQTIVELRGRFSNPITEYKKIGASRLNYVLCEELLTGTRP